MCGSVRSLPVSKAQRTAAKAGALLEPGDMLTCSAVSKYNTEHVPP